MIVHAIRRSLPTEDDTRRHTPIPSNVNNLADRQLTRGACPLTSGRASAQGGTVVIGYIMRRVALAFGTLLVVSIIAFLIIQLPPGDYVDGYVGLLESQGDVVSAEREAMMRDQFGLNRPMAVQYLSWIADGLKGDFGLSFEYRRPVIEVIGDRIWLTVAVALSAVLFIWAMALPIGIYAAVRQYSVGDYVVTFIGFLGLAIPNFLLALIVMYIALRYMGAEVGGLFSTAYVTAPWSWGKFLDLLGHIWIPAVILGIGGTASLIRIMRANLLDELSKPYVVAARARGLSKWALILKYPVRIALNPFISTVGYVLPYIVSGSIVVSIVLSLPTVGPLLLRALLAQDMYLAGTIIMMIGAMTVLGTLISDLLLMWIDPRIRFGRR